VHWNLGLVHEQLGEFEAAEKLYAQVPQNSPDSDDAAFRIGHLRLERADYPGSIQALEACLEKRPNWPEARLNLGIAHWRAGDKEAARVCFQELTASGADSKEALRGLAALALEHQEYDKAFEIYRQLLDSGERTPELLYNAGLICQRRGEAEDAAVLYKEALKANPQFGEALLNLGHALMSLGNEFEARSCWRKAVIAKPELAQQYFEPAAQAS
jgi:tetratricopeptide (TPR) repeat protein